MADARGIGTVTSYLLKSAAVFDGSSPDLTEDDVVVENGRIVDIAPRLSAAAATQIDLAGQTLMPGIIDAHVHVYASELNLTSNMRRPWTYLAQYAHGFLGHMLSYGVTSIRDVGGGDYGLAQALANGLVMGPRLFYGGRLLSTTGGHADWRPGQEDDHDHHLCNCGAIDQKLAVLADGPDAVLRAVRDELRRGADHIKIVASGGVASPNDPVDNLQFTDDEIRTICDEVTRHGRYVAAHCHPAAAVERSVRLGVRTIEHGTLIDDATARYVAEQGAYLVPTMAVIYAFHEDGAKYGLPPASVRKIEEVFGHAQSGMERMKKAGCKIGFGTDLLGLQHTRHGTEFTLRKDVFTSLEILRQATSTNAEILNRSGEIGCIRVGARADLIAVRGNPLDDIELLAAQGRHLSLIMRDGVAYKNENR